MQIDIEMRITALKAREDFRKEVGTHHRRNTDLDRALLELLVVVDFEHGILYVAQRNLDASEKDRTFGCKGELFLTAVKELYAELALEFFDRNGDIRLGNAEAFGGARNILEPARHLEIFQLP